ncbi:PREDICTED: uncharacterized protein LOC105155084 [Acromyrmex echinatior]|uniref:uncharacterized protein LOC105155084 n=1 Tax=Acromyrmex echinatior TaxID=103372 RepID=UPI000580F66F|nr:PREDICTED: uncharacterized protein LOC105155084 [Acromyrmex echinatior]
MEESKRRSKVREEEEREISKKEIVEVIKKIKDGKAVGVNGVPREVWKYEEKQLGIGKKAMALFVDLRAAFDSVDRGILYKAMTEGGIKEGLIERVKKVLSETNGESGRKDRKEFLDREGSKSAEPVAIQHSNSRFGGGDGKWREIRLGERKIYKLAYADNIVLLSKDEEGIRSMIGRMEEYLERKRLDVNKTK